MQRHSALGEILETTDPPQGHYNQSEYGEVILPRTALRRLDHVLKPMRKDVLKADEVYRGHSEIDSILSGVARKPNYNRSKHTFNSVVDERKKSDVAFRGCIGEFSLNVEDIIKEFDFYPNIDKLNKVELLYQLLSRFSTTAGESKTSSPPAGFGGHPTDFRIRWPQTEWVGEVRPRFQSQVKERQQ